MEIEQLRKEINELLENVVEHSNSYSGNRQIPSLEISFVLSKISKMQEALIILKHLVKENELAVKRQKKAESTETTLPSKNDTPIIQTLNEEPITTTPVVETTPEIKAEDVEEKIIIEPEKPKSKKDIEKLPIAKLVDAFSLNDRYLYANELFNKNMSAFNELVKAIDECSSYPEALDLTNNVQKELGWDKENIHVLSFGTLVERRFL